jgi:FkbM family methyltransferase
MSTLNDLESMIRRVFNYFGIDIHRYHPDKSEPSRLARFLRIHGIDTILDVGANTGQFGSSLRAAGFHGRIVSFEPLRDAHEELVRASRGDPNWDVAPRAALGGRDGEVMLHIAANSESSSILSMLDSHEQAAPQSKYIGAEKVPLYRLDSIVDRFLSRDSRVLLKIDVQGYEARVLDGAPELLQRVTGVQLELSLLPLYAGQELMPEMVERMRENGFELWSLTPNFVDQSNGRMLQFDGLFFR